MIDSKGVPASTLVLQLVNGFAQLAIFLAKSSAKHAAHDGIHSVNKTDQTESTFCGTHGYVFPVSRFDA
jgi:hypothetical protein